MTTRRLLLTTATFLLLASGASGAGALARTHTPSRASAPPANSKGSSPKGIAAVVGANNRFAFDLYSALSDTETGNLVYSPYSISSVLAMAYEGADGKTASEMKSVFHFPASRILEPNSAAIFNDLNSSDNGSKLQVGNALWAQKAFHLRSEYIKAVKQYFGGKAMNLDFVHKTESSRQTINRYIAKRTGNRITDLIPKGELDKMSRLVLTNAVYFKGAWQSEFDPSDTYQGDFYVSSDKTVKTSLMVMHDAIFNYAYTDSFQILELPYRGKKISMLLLLPRKGRAETSLTAKDLKDLKARMRPTSLEWVAFPKFEFRSTYRLNNTLKAMGMPTPFSNSADFSGMTGRRNLFIKFVLHQAYIKVDEKGTEAAAATGGGSALVSLGPYFQADRPFLFVIQDNKTGNILFLGRVSDPNSSS